MNTMLERIRATAIMLVIAAALIVPSAAMAATPVTDQYGNPTTVAGEATGPTTTTTTKTGLPFTGAEITYLLLGGLLLSASAYALHRAGREDEDGSASRN